jgi:hypothetical protein
MDRSRKRWQHGYTGRVGSSDLVKIIVRNKRVWIEGGPVKVFS